MVFGFLYNQKRKVKAFKTPESEAGGAGVCASCGESAAKVEVQDTYRFCLVPLFRRSRQRIMCSTCEWISES